MDALKARDAKDVEQAVRDAIASEQPLEIIGHGSKRAIGQPMATNALLDVSALNGVVSYEPHELIITVQAGAPLADVLSLIDSKNQEFSFDPVNTAPLLGTSAGAGTIGGMIASGLSGSRRIKAGGVRDHLLGATAVSGFGDTYVAGGKVVKNVTGYDLCKLIAGSWGTLSVLTEVTLKVMPKAESECTLMIAGLDEMTANRAMIAAMGSAFDVSGAAHLPKPMSDHPALAGHAGKPVTLMRIEGIAASVADRAKSLEGLLTPFGASSAIKDEESSDVWSAIRDVAPFAAHGPRGSWPVWRIVCPPASGGALGLALVRETGGEVFYDWGGGLIWAAVPADAEAHANAVRKAVSAVGGHATLIRATDAARRAVDVFHPQERGVALLAQRVKTSFDPKNILNRGRLRRP